MYMNQEQNNFNMQGNNGISNNQLLNNQNLNQGMDFNYQPNNFSTQQMSGDNQSIMQSSFQQTNNNVSVSNNVNNDNLNNKLSKKKNLGLIVGMLILVVIIGILFASKLFSNEDNNNNENLSGNNRYNSNLGEEIIISNEFSNLKVNYVEILEKKIYFDLSFDELIYQFNGLGFKVGLPFYVKIDDCDKDYFHNLIVSDSYENKNKFGIYHTDIAYTYTDFIIYFENLDVNNQNIKYIDRKIDKIYVNVPQDESVIYIDDTYINLGIDDNYVEDDIINKIGKYNSFIKISDYEYGLIYKTKDYNITFFTYSDLEMISNGKEFEIHGFEIDYI